jgi:hypothetical protein
MKKIKLYSIGNKKDYNYYVFDKKNKVIEIIAKILGAVFQASWPLYSENHDTGKSRKINFENSKEGHSNIIGGNSNAKIDVFYGAKKLTLIIHCNLSLRRKLNEKLGEISHMPKQKIRKTVIDASPPKNGVLSDFKPRRLKKK